MGQLYGASTGRDMLCHSWSVFIQAKCYSLRNRNFYNWKHIQGRLLQIMYERNPQSIVEINALALMKSSIKKILYKFENCQYLGECNNLDCSCILLRMAIWDRYASLFLCNVCADIRIVPNAWRIHVFAIRHTIRMHCIEKAMHVPFYCLKRSSMHVSVKFEAQCVYKECP